MPACCTKCGHAPVTINAVRCPACGAENPNPGVVSGIVDILFFVLVAVAVFVIVFVLVFALVLK
jgi:hypothetical protein